MRCCVPVGLFCFWTFHVPFHVRACDRNAETDLVRSARYTCIGLSLIETVFHEEPQAQERQRPPNGENAAGLAPLRDAWVAGGAGALCADKYAADADRRSASHDVSASDLTTPHDRR